MIDWVGGGRRGRARHRRARRGARPRPEARRGHPRLQRARDAQPDRRDRAHGARGRRAGPRRRRPGGAEARPSTSPSSASTSTRSPATRSTAPTGIGALWARLDLLERDAAVPRRRIDDPQGHQGRARPMPTRPPASRPARPRSPRRSASRRRCAGSTASGWRPSPAHEREIAAYALERAGRGPGPARLRPARLPRARSARSRFELEGVHAHDVSEILDRHGVAVRAGHHCAQPLMERLGVAGDGARQLRRSTRRPRRSTGWSRASPTPAGSSGSAERHGRALPRPDPRALQAPAQLRPARRASTSTTRTRTRSAATSSTSSSSSTTRAASARSASRVRAARSRPQPPRC